MNGNIWLHSTVELTGRFGPYFADPGLIMSANVALKLNRPLLLTGEPGCGKTDFAWAMAGALANLTGHALLPPLECHVRSDTRARDFLYTYDSIMRFGDTHHGGPAGLQRASDPRNYIELEPLGEALASNELRVVLIDEIDKAPRDLPNDLLRELEHRTFIIQEIPEGLRTPPVMSRGYRIERRMGVSAAMPGPFVVITSNAERHLPDAFLRRCVFWHIASLSLEQLDRVVRARFPSDPPPLLEAATEVFCGIRGIAGIAKPPATAELLDWIVALKEIGRRDKRALVLKRFQELARCGERSPDWMQMPALGCLIKSRDDLGLLAG